MRVKVIECLTEFGEFTFINKFKKTVVIKGSEYMVGDNFGYQTKCLVECDLTEEVGNIVQKEVLIWGCSTNTSRFIEIKQNFEDTNLKTLKKLFRSN